MSVRSGFFNSNNGDRRYFTTDISELFNGLILNGVFSTIGTAFTIKPAENLGVTIGIGKAWFDSGWLFNDSVLTEFVEQSDILLPRYDAFVLDFDNSDAVRQHTIKYIKGVPATNPQYPNLIKSAEQNQYPIGYILRPANSTTIELSNIEMMVGQTECPFVTGLLQQLDITEILGQWQGQWNEWFAEFEADLLREQEALNQWITSEQTDFLTWYQSMKDQLSEDAAGHLQNEIDLIKDDGSINLYTIDETSTTTELKLLGRGLNGKFKMDPIKYTSAVTLSNITINNVVYTVKQGSSDEIELHPGAIIPFILDEGTLTVNFNSGGGESSISITFVGGLEEPSPVKNNTVWLKSAYYGENDVPKYTIGYSKPENPIFREVFCLIDTTQDVYLYADKKSLIQISIASCEYWDGATWIQLDFQTYSDDEWRGGSFSGPYILYQQVLYHDDWVDNSYGNSYVKFEDGRFLMHWNLNNGGDAFLTFKDVNLTNKSSVSFVASGNNQHYVRITEKDKDPVTSSVAQAGGHGGAFSVDVSTLVGVYQVSILVVAYTNQGGYTSTLYTLALNE